MPGAWQTHTSGTQIPLLSPVLQAPVEVDTVMETVQILAKCHFILSRQTYNLQMGLEFCSRLCHYVKATCLYSLCLWLFLSC